MIKGVKGCIWLLHHLQWSLTEGADDNSCITGCSNVSQHKVILLVDMCAGITHGQLYHIHKPC
jgi:hypothetical protein